MGVSLTYELRVFEKMGQMVCTVVFHFEEGAHENARSDTTAEAIRLRSLGYNVQGFLNEKRVEPLEWL